MERIAHFVPGEPIQADELLAAWRAPIPVGVARAYAEAYANPGEVVLVPYCQGAEEVRDILASGRRALAVNFDPALVLLVQQLLTPLPAREVDSAVTRLGDSPKHGVPLRNYLEDLYATTCPACLRPAVAEYFVWEREPGAPVAKYLRCPACSWDGQTAVDGEDLERLGKIPGQGMHYHFVLDRVAPTVHGEAIRARMEYLLEFYSPRNLYALAELTLKIEGQFSQEPLLRTLKGLLLDCLDRCSYLAPLPGQAARRRGLTRPGRFLERNVWRAFEEAVARFRLSAGRPTPGLAASLDVFQASPQEWAGFVGMGLVRDLPRILPHRSVHLILTSAPALDSAVWSLSYLWSAWLLGAETAAPLRPLLRQRTPDPVWYARVMSGSLSSLVDLLRDDGRLVLVLTDQRPAVVEALALAAGRARMGVASLVQCGADYRLELTPSLAGPVAASAGPLENQIRDAAVDAAAEAIRERGEPVPWRALHAAILRRLAALGLLARVWEEQGERPSGLDRLDEQIEEALEHPSLLRLVGGEKGELWWWLPAPVHVSSALGDRVELAAYQVLQDALALTRADFAARLYARFPGVLTPAAGLVDACLSAYGHEPTPGYWQLRTEDLPDARDAERRLMISNLLELGHRLGYQARPEEPFDVAWFHGNRMRAVFVVQWQAALGEALALSDRTAGARPYLVIPGGRAALVSYKLSRNPFWRETVDRAGWRFIKYRHVRELLSQPEVDEYALRTITGLDPIVERESAQIPLF